mgnify:CR=1 FL=1
MLSFEDETPSPTLGLQLLHSTPSGLTSPAQAPKPAQQAPQKSPSPLGDLDSPSPLGEGRGGGAQHTRVRAEDKRVINAKTDVNQLVPFKYKWPWEPKRRASNVWSVGPEHTALR